MGYRLARHENYGDSVERGYCQSLRRSMVVVQASFNLPSFSDQTAARYERSTVSTLNNKMVGEQNSDDSNAHLTIDRSNSNVMIMYDLL